MFKKCVSVCVVLALVFSLTSAFATGSFSFSDAFGGGQSSDSGSGQSGDSFSFSDAFGGGQSTDSGADQSGDSFSFSNDSQSPGSADSQLTEFVYRDGIKFGMTVDQVKKLEKNEPAEEHWEKSYSTNYPENMYYVKYTNEKTLSYSCDIEYHFSSKEGNLLRIYVKIALPGGRTYDAIVSQAYDQYVEIDNALAEKYGPPDGPSSYSNTLIGMEEATYWSSNKMRNFSIKHASASTSYGRNHYIYYSYVDQGTGAGV